MVAPSVHRSAAPSSDAVVIHLSGEIDLESAHDVSTLLDDAATGPLEELVLDLSQATFVDGTGLRLLLGARDRVQGRLWLRGPSAQVSWLLDVAGLTATFSILEVTAQVAAADAPAAGAPAAEVSAAEAPAAETGPRRSNRAPVVPRSPVEELELQVAGLTEAMRGRAVIEQAKGLVMGTHRCTAGDAWERLTQASQDHNVRVHDLCASLTSAAAGHTTCPPGADVLIALRAVMGDRATPGRNRGRPARSTR